MFVQLRRNHCLRCGHDWTQRHEGKITKKCSKCNSPYWQTKKGELPMGRPRKKKEEGK